MRALRAPSSARSASTSSATFATDSAAGIPVPDRGFKQAIGDAAYAQALAANTSLRRELHDSVTQTIFSMTLTTQSAALLLEHVGWADEARAVEAAVEDDNKVEKLPTPPHDSVYSHQPLYAVRVAGLFGIGPSFRVAGVLIGLWATSRCN